MIVENKIEEMTSEKLIGRQVRFVMNPELVGQIVAVRLFYAGRVFSVQYFHDSEFRESDVDAFQLELI